MSQFSLSFRRFAAFGIDLCILGCPLLLLIVCSYFEFFQWHSFVSVFALMGATFYFTLWETKNRGQTPGKVLLNIRVCKKDGSVAGNYELLLRSVIVVFSYTYIQLFVSVIEYAFSLDLSSFLNSAGLFLSGILILPMSVLVGSGERGLNDLLADTKVVKCGDEFEKSDKDIDRHSYLRRVSALAVLVIAITSPFIGKFFRSVQYVFDQANHGKQVTVGAVGVPLPIVVDTNYLYSKIENAGLYFDGIVFSTYKGQGARTKASELSFEMSPYPSIQDFMRSHINGTTEVIVANVKTTQLGMRSAEFQRYITNLILEMFGRPSVLLLVEFNYQFSTEVFMVFRGRRLVGGIGAGKGRRLAPFVVEPDKSNQIGFGVGMSMGKSR